MADRQDRKRTISDRYISTRSIGRIVIPQSYKIVYKNVSVKSLQNSGSRLNTDSAFRASSVT